MDTIAALLAHFPRYSEDLGIDLKTPAGRFKWFLASLLFGARISETIAINTYHSFARELNQPGADPRRGLGRAGQNPR